jgi:hypothetical protein
MWRSLWFVCLDVWFCSFVAPLGFGSGGAFFFWVKGRLRWGAGWNLPTRVVRNLLEESASKC